jgi:hypothetical protein
MREHQIEHDKVGLMAPAGWVKGKQQSPPIAEGSHGGSRSSSYRSYDSKETIITEACYGFYRRECDMYTADGYTAEGSAKGGS